MAKTQNGAISWGLVHIPVELHLAVGDNDVHFNQVVSVKGTGELSRVRYKKVCSATGREVENHEIRKAFEYDKGRYVLVEDHELEALKTERNRNLTVVQFADLHAIQPMLFNKSYHLLPQKGGEKPFELLRAAMLAEEQVAIARTVIGATERLVAIMPREEGLVMVTLFFESDVKPIPKIVTPTQVTDEELAMARMLLGSMKKEFDGSSYGDEYQEKLRALIDEKIRGQETQPEALTLGNTVVDLMEALKASLEQNPSPKKKSKAAKAA